jgi:hypothetical protein
MGKKGPSVKFQKQIRQPNHDQWYSLTARLNVVTLNEKGDVVIWKWTANNQFSVKSVYDH